MSETKLLDLSFSVALWSGAPHFLVMKVQQCLSKKGLKKNKKKKLAKSQVSVCITVMFDWS